MVDVTLLRQAEKLGYAVIWLNGRAYYCRHEDERKGVRLWSFPFKTEDEAALAAINYHETRRAQIAYLYREITETHRETLAALT